MRLYILIWDIISYFNPYLTVLYFYSEAEIGFDFEF